MGSTFSPKEKLFDTEPFPKSEIHSLSSDLKNASKPRKRSWLAFEGCLEKSLSLQKTFKGDSRHTCKDAQGLRVA